MKVNSRGNVHVHYICMYIQVRTYIYAYALTYIYWSYPPLSQYLFFLLARNLHNHTAYPLDFITYLPFPLRDLLLIYITVLVHSILTTPTTAGNQKYVTNYLYFASIPHITIVNSQLMTFVFLSSPNPFDPTYHNINYLREAIWFVKKKIQILYRHKDPPFLLFTRQVSPFFFFLVFFPMWLTLLVL